MHSVTSILLFAILATLALAAPTQKRNLNKRSFNIPRIRQPNFERNPIQAVAHAYHKHGWMSPFDLPSFPDFPSPSSSASPASSNAGSGSFGSGGSWNHSSTPSSAASSPYSTSTGEASAVSATPADAAAEDKATGNQTGETTASSADQGAEYVCPVTIGTQTLNLDFDTGSADLWVFSTSLSTSEIGQHTAFNPAKSTTFKAKSGYTWEIMYGDNSGASGTVGTDTVKVGSATVTTQAVEIATQVSSQFVTDTASDGLLGLAFSTLNQVEPKQQNTFFANVMSQLEQPVFTADLIKDGSGSYEFGTIDSSKYTGAITYADIDSSSGFWQVASDSYSIGGKVSQNSGAPPAIIDTGTSLMLVDDAVATAYYAQVDGAYNDGSQGGYVYPCSSTLPDFAVAIGSGGYMAKIPGSAVTYATLSRSLCFGGIQSNAAQPSLQIYGDVLITNSFIVFDGGNERIGFAAKA